LATELLEHYGNAVDCVTLIPSSGDVFEVEKNGRKLFSKKGSGRFPDEGEIIRLVESD